MIEVHRLYCLFLSEIFYQLQIITLTDCDVEFILLLPNTCLLHIYSWGLQGCTCTWIREQISWSVPQMKDNRMRVPLSLSRPILIKTHPWWIFDYPCLLDSLSLFCNNPRPTFSNPNQSSPSIQPRTVILRCSAIHVHMVDT